MVWLPFHAGAFLDYLERTGERLIALFVLTVYCGLRRGEVLGLHWPDVDLDLGVAFVRETGDDGTPKSDSGVRPVPLPAPVVAALRAWRKVQAADQLAWGPDWPETDLVFTREDGTPVPGQWVSVRFETLAYRADLPPVRFHDLRHGAASLCKAAGLDTKFISALLGHARTSFTDDVYVLLFPEVAKAAAEAAAAIVPRASKKRRDIGCHQMHAAPMSALRTAKITVLLDPRVVDLLDAYRAERRWTRSTAIAALVEEGLTREAAKDGEEAP